MNFRLVQPSAIQATQQTATPNCTALNAQPPVQLVQTSEKLVTVQSVSNAPMGIH